MILRDPPDQVGRSANATSEYLEKIALCYCCHASEPCGSCGRHHQSRGEQEYDPVAQSLVRRFVADVAHLVHEFLTGKMIGVFGLPLVGLYQEKFGPVTE